MLEVEELIIIHHKTQEVGRVAKVAVVRAAQIKLKELMD